VTSGGQSTGSAQNLVNWAPVDSGGRWLAVSLGHIPDEWTFNEQLLGLRLVDHMNGLVPSATFKEKSKDEDAILRLFSDIGWLDLIIDLVVK
jgi:hypothetical protein